MAWTDLGNIDFGTLPGLTSVVIGDGITQIQDQAFRNCRSLASVVIGNGVTNIGYERLRIARTCRAWCSGRTWRDRGHGLQDVPQPRWR